MDQFETDKALSRATEAGVVADIARHAVAIGPRIIDTNAGRFALLRDGDGTERLEALDPEGGLSTMAPQRIAQRVTVQTESSLAAYANRYKTATSKAALFADIDTDTIVAVLDFHESSDGETAGDAGFGEHVATLSLPRSWEWKAWTQVDGKLVPQLEFCRFLEENREDIRSPDAATILEACRDLQALRRVDFRSVVREDSDNYRIEYNEERETTSRKGDITLPSEFILSIPVYFGGPEVEVRALLRWKLDDDGVLTLGVKLKRAERIRQAEFHRVVTDLSEQTGVDAFYGKRG